MEELIARRYVKALTAASKEVASLAEALTVLSETVNQVEVGEILSSPLVAESKKTEMLLSIVGEDKILVNFIKILGEHKRLGLIPMISKVLNADLQRESNQYEGVLKSSKKVSKEEVTQLEKTLEKYTGSTIKLKQEKTDLDGMRVSVDDLGIEVNFSKQRVKEQLIDFIKKSL